MGCFTRTKMLGTKVQQHHHHHNHHPRTMQQMMELLFSLCFCHTHLCNSPRLGCMRSNTTGEMNISKLLTCGLRDDDDGDGFGHPWLGLNLCSYHPYHNRQVPSFFAVLISSKNQNRQCSIHSYFVNATSCIIVILQQKPTSLTPP